MVIDTIDDSQRGAARAAGWSYLLTFAIVVYVNFGIHDRLIVAGNAVETARRILAHEQLFRAGILGDLLYCAGVIVQLTALYVILRPISRGLALLAAAWRLAWVLAWLAMTLRLFNGLRLVKGAAYLQVLEPERAQALARLEFGARFDYYYVGLLFGSLASTVCGYLWLKSRYIPRALALAGLIMSAWCVACTVAFLVAPGFADVVNLWWFDTPMGLFEIALSLWLLIRGLRPGGTAPVPA